MCARTSSSRRVHERANLREPLPQTIGDRSPLATGLGFTLLGEHGTDERGHHLTPTLGDVNEDVPQAVDPQHW